MKINEKQWESMHNQWQNKENQWKYNKHQYKIAVTTFTRFHTPTYMYTFTYVCMSSAQDKFETPNTGETIK